MPRSDRFTLAWAAVLATAAACLTIHPEYEGDAFWHMSLGREVLAQRSRTVAEPLALAPFTSPAVVPEWLWAVLTLGVYRTGSWAALVAMFALLSALAAVLCVVVVRKIRSDAAPSAVILVSGLVMGVLVARLRSRPESAGLVLALVFLWLVYQYVNDKGRARLKISGALIGVEVLWAQLHGSFLLAPAIFACIAGPDVFADRGVGARRNVHFVTIVGLVLGLCTGAHGLSLTSYIGAHAHGDAVQHVTDMVAPAWRVFNPLEVVSNPFHVVMVATWLVGAAGMIASRRVFGRALVLMLVGAALMLDAVRFVTFATILSLPLATEGAAELGVVLSRTRWSQVGGALGVTVAVLCVVICGHRIERVQGPLGRIGPVEAVHPLAGAAFLRGLAEGGRVLSVYNAGGSLGYVLNGRARIYVDGRTPLYFDDTDFGISRDVFEHPDALARAIDRFDATALVVNRDSPVCSKVPAGWIAAVVESHYTTFVRDKIVPAVSSLSPCGNTYFSKTFCQDPAALDQDIGRLAPLGETPFVRYVRAERAFRCGPPSDTNSDIIPSRSEARDILAYRDRLAVEWLLRKGDVVGAVGVAELAAQEGDVGTVGLILPALVGESIQASRARSILQTLVERLDDRTPAEMRAVLGLACAAENDVECARFHGFRAAVGGASQAAPLLIWLRSNDTSMRGRADASAWLDTLLRMPPRTSPADSAKPESSAVATGTTRAPASSPSGPSSAATISPDAAASAGPVSPVSPSPSSSTR